MRRTQRIPHSFFFGFGATIDGKTLRKVKEYEQDAISKPVLPARMRIPAPELSLT
jgi:hypothetical protein